jgi:pectate lyase
MSGITNIIYAIVMLLLVWPTYNKIAYSRPEGKEIALVPAFPGATGGGMYTTGGRGGNVIKVTNLNDKGPGSLREAIETPGKRTILFDVSGTIKLESQILVTHGDLTIAGHSAPGDGICIKGHEFRIEADNIIIRYMRFRPGDIAGKEYDAITGMRNP